VSDSPDLKGTTVMTTVRVFDPAMCCSTGVCGPSVEPHLARFAADLGWLQSQGVAVERFNLAQQPAAFAGDRAVREALEAHGEAGLPVVQVNGETKSTGLYPTRAELAAWSGLGKPTARKLTLTPAAEACCTPADGAAGAGPTTKAGRCC
jgi:hypothetical protein